MDEAEGVLRLTAARSDGPLKLMVGYASHVEGSTLAPLLETGQPRIINDLESYLQQHTQSASTSLIVEEGMRSSLTLPLICDGKGIGVVFFSNRETGIYQPSHAILLHRLAGHIAIAVERTRLIAELREKNRQLADANKTKDQFLDLLQNEVSRQTEQLRFSEERYRLLVQLGRVVNSSLDLRQVFRQAAEQIFGLLTCDRVSLLLVDRRETSRHGFALEWQRNKPHWVDIASLPLTGSAAGWVMDRRVPRIARDLGEDHQFPEDKRLSDQGYSSYAYLPLVCRNQSVGVLGIASKAARQPDRWDLELLRELCDQLAVALDNAAAYGEIERLKVELEQQNTYLRDEIKTDHDFHNIIGDSRAMQDVRNAIDQVAQTRLHRFDPGRNRHRQGIDRSCDSRCERAIRQVVGQSQLCGPRSQFDYE